MRLLKEKRRSHPFYWASFVTAGRWSAFESSAPAAWARSRLGALIPLAGGIPDPTRPVPSKSRVARLWHSGGWARVWRSG